MGNVSACRTQGGFGKVTQGFKTVETGFFKSGDRLHRGWRRADPEERKTHRVSGLPCLVPSSCLPISGLLKFNPFAGFDERVWLFDY